MSEHSGEIDENPACCSIPPDDHTHDSGHDHGHGEEDRLWSLAAPLLFFIAGMALESVLTSFGLRAAYYLVMAAAYLLCGLPVLKEAWRTVRRGDYFNEFTLMSAATLAAIALGEMSEAVGVMLFYSIGEALQEKAAGRSRKSIKTLLASKPDKANRIVDGKIAVVEPEAVEPGSVILVKPGEKVPLDGIIEAGAANLDMSSITGEPVPAAVKAGDKAYSGSICLDGDLTVRTTERYENSMVGRILSMVEEASETKSHTERFITRFSRYYTPAVVAAAALVAVVPPLFLGAAWNVWAYRALVLLVVSCPCALMLSVPLAFFAGIGTASRHGVLVKGGQVFDALLRARTVILDKTGTITAGKPAVVEVLPAEGVDENELLRLAALAENRSNHPAARAIMRQAGEAGVDPAVLGEAAIQDIPGKGIIAATPEGEIAVGNQALMADLGIAGAPADDGRLSVHAAKDKTYLGSLRLEDKIKPEAPAALRALRQVRGVEKIYMLTGDREENARRIAQEAGLDGYLAGLLPDGKVAAFEKLSPDGTAAYVGDGVNDAPVLARAGVGVAMGALGAAAAVEAADAVILDDSPSRLPILFRTAEKVRRVAWENIVFALAVKTVVMLLGVAGLSGLWEAVFADVGVALLAVLNSMRVTRI